MPLISLLQVTLILDQGRKGTALIQARFGRHWAHRQRETSKRDSTRGARGDHRGRRLKTHCRSELALLCTSAMHGAVPA